MPPARSASNAPKGDKQLARGSAPGPASPTDSSAPKVPNIPAQGSALGSRHPTNPSPEGADDLPPSWTWQTVGELAAKEPRSIVDGPFGSKLKTAHYTDSGPRVIRLQNIGEGEFFDARAYISEEHFRTLKSHQIQAGDIVIAGMGENPPRACIIPEFVGPAIVKADCIRFKPAAEHSVKYLVYALNSPGTRRRTKDIVHGVGRPRLNQSEIKAIQLPIAPPDQQRRIVARIEELFSRIDAGVAALRHAKAHLQRYRQSVLTAAVTGQFTQAWREKNDVTSDEWQSLSIGEISDVKTGKTPNRSESEYWTNGTIPWLTSSATSNDFTHQADQFVTQEALGTGLKMFAPGTLLLAMYGEGKTRGQVTEITFQATCNQACAAIIVDEAKALRAFVRMRLQENYEQTRKAASGGNQPNLNLTKVREIPLQLPPLAEQHQIVSEVEARTTLIDHLEAELDRQITRSHRLRQSTLAAAFSGQF